MAYINVGGTAGYMCAIGGAWCFIDKSGAIVPGKRFANPDGIPSVKAFSDGRAAFKENGKWGFVDKSLNVVIPPTFDDVDDFHAGRAAVQAGALWGFIDLNGKKVIEAKYASVDRYVDGLAPVQTSTRSLYIDEAGNSKIDIDGCVIGEHPFFSEGLASVCLFDRLLYGFIDERGKTAISPTYDEVTPFFGNRAGVCKHNDGHNLWGFIDRSGTYRIPPKYESIDPDAFSRGLCLVHLRRKGRIGHRESTIAQYIDRNGRVVWSEDMTVN
jgi:hypothetical protein